MKKRGWNVVLSGLLAVGMMVSVAGCSQEPAAPVAPAGTEAPAEAAGGVDAPEGGAGRRRSRRRDRGGISLDRGYDRSGDYDQL